MELEDLNVYAQLKAKPALCIAYLETYEMLRQIEASGQHEVGLLASASRTSRLGSVWNLPNQPLRSKPIT